MLPIKIWHGRVFRDSVLLLGLREKMSIAMWTTPLPSPPRLLCMYCVQVGEMVRLFVNGILHFLRGLVFLLANIFFFFGNLFPS